MVQRILEIDTDKQILLCCTLWRWWTCRNKLNAEGQNFSVDEVVRQGNYWAAECYQYYQTTSEHETEPVVARWRSPPAELVKLNIDGAFSESTRRGGWGFIARDHEGTCRASGAGCIPYVASPIQAEAIACQEAVKAAANWGMGRIQIETDCANLVRAIQSNDLDLTPEGVIYRDIWSFVNLNFSSFEILFCPRGCNKSAHGLAAFGANQGDYRLLWLEYVPEHVCVIVASELTEPI
jgi:hypothetical protein